MKIEEKKKLMNQASQIAIPMFTIGSQVVLAMKLPQWALILSLLAQPFWIYSTWKSYKEAGQVGILVNTIVITFVIAAGVFNYWFL